MRFIVFGFTLLLAGCATVISPSFEYNFEKTAKLQKTMYIRLHETKVKREHLPEDIEKLNSFILGYKRNIQYEQIFKTEFEKWFSKVVIIPASECQAKPKLKREKRNGTYIDIDVPKGFWRPDGIYFHVVSAMTLGILPSYMGLKDYVVLKIYDHDLRLQSKKMTKYQAGEWGSIFLHLHSRKTGRLIFAGNDYFFKYIANSVAIDVYKELSGKDLP